MADISKFNLPDGNEYSVKDEAARNALETKQDALVAGENIVIENNEISASSPAGFVVVNGVVCQEYDV